MTAPIADRPQDWFDGLGKTKAREPDKTEPTSAAAEPDPHMHAHFFWGVCPSAAQAPVFGEDMED